MDNLYEVLAEDFNRHSRPLSAATLEAMGVEIARAAHSFAGLPFGAAQRSLLEEGEQAGWVKRQFRQLVDKPLNPEPWRRAAVEMLGRIDTSGDEGYKKRIETGILQIKVGKEPRAIIDDPDTQDRLSRSLKGAGINLHDFASIVNLTREGARVGDLVKEYGRGMLHASTIFGAEAERHVSGSFAEATESAFVGAIEGAITYNPARGRFFHHVIGSQHAAVRAESRSVKRTLERYRGTTPEQREDARTQLRQAAHSLFERHATDPATRLLHKWPLSDKDLTPDQRAFLEEEGLPRIQSREFTLGDALSWIDKYTGNVSAEELRRLGFEDPGTYDLPPRKPAMWDFFQRYVDQYGQIPMSSGIYTARDAHRQKPVWMTGEQFGQVRQHLEGKRWHELDDKYKRILQNLKNTYAGLTAGGWGTGEKSGLEIFSEMEERARERNPFVDDEGNPLHDDIDYDYDEEGDEVASDEYEDEGMIVYDTIDDLEDEYDDIDRQLSEAYGSWATRQLRDDIKGSPQVEGFAFAMAKRHRIGKGDFKKDPHYTTMKDVFTKAGISGRSWSPQAWALHQDPKTKHWTHKGYRKYRGQELERVQRAVKAERELQKPYQAYRQPLFSDKQAPLPIPQPAGGGGGKQPPPPPAVVAPAAPEEPERDSNPTSDRAPRRADSWTFPEEQMEWTEAVRRQYPVNPAFRGSVQSNRRHFAETQALYRFAATQGKEIPARLTPATWYWDGQTTNVDVREMIDHGAYLSAREQIDIGSAPPARNILPPGREPGSEIVAQRSVPSEREPIRMGHGEHPDPKGVMEFEEFAEIARAVDADINPDRLWSWYEQHLETYADHVPSEGADFDDIEPIPLPGERPIEEPVPVRGAGSLDQFAQQAIRSIAPTLARRLIGEADVDLQNPARYYSGVPFVSHRELAQLEGGLMILGSAGTGKTHAMARLAGARAQAGADVSRMGFVTGTTTARQRFTSRVRSGEFGREITGMERIHSINQMGMQALKRLRGYPEFGISAIFSHKDIVGPLELGSLVAGGLESYGAEELDRLAPTGEYREGFTKLVKDYTRAFEGMTMEGHTAQDLDDPEVARYYEDKYNVASPVLKHVAGFTRDILDKSGRMILSEQVTKPVEIAQSHPEAAEIMFGDQFDLLMIDEAHQLSPAGRRLMELVTRANPDADVVAGFDPLQASIWHFMGGSAETMLELSEAGKLDIVGLQQTHRLRQGIIEVAADQFDMPGDIRPISAVDRSDLPGEDQIRDAIELRVGEDAHDTARIAVRHAKDLIAKGVDPQDIMLQAHTNKMVDVINEVAEQQGLKTFSYLREEDFLDAVLKGEMTEEEARQAQMLQEVPEDAVHTATIHKSEGLEAKHNVIVLSDKDLPETTPEEKYESRSLLYTALTRSHFDSEDPESGRAVVVGQRQRGGLPRALSGYGLTFQASQRAAKELGTGMGGARQLYLSTHSGDDVREFIQSFAGAELGVQLPEEIEDKIRTMGATAANQAVAASRRGDIGSTVQDLNDYAAKALSASVNALGEELLSQMEEDSPQRRRQAKSIRDAVDRMVDESRAYYGYGQGAFGPPGTPPPGDTGYGPGAAGYSRGFGRSDGADGDGSDQNYSWYKQARGLWALNLASRSFQRAFEQEMNRGRQYGGYLGAFAPFAAMEGPLTDSRQFFAVRQAQVQRMMAQGAWEQWGSFTEIPGMFGGGHPQDAGAFPRLATVGRSAWNVGMGFGQAGIAASLMGGDTGLAMGLGKVGLALGGTMLLGAGAMELYNAFRPEGTTPMTYGKLFVDMPMRAAAMRQYRSQAMEQYAQAHSLTVGDVESLYTQERRTRMPGVGRRPGTLGIGVASDASQGYGMIGQRLLGLQLPLNIGTPVRDEVDDLTWNIIREEEPALAARFELMDTLANRAEALAEELEDLTGEDVGRITGTLMRMMQDRPDITDDQITRFAQQGASLGYGTQYYQMMRQLAVSRGLMPGTAGFDAYLDQTGLGIGSAIEFETYAEEVARISGLGAQLDQHFTRPRMGQLMMGVVADQMPVTQAGAAAMSSAAAIMSAGGFGNEETALAALMVAQDTPFRSTLVNQAARTWQSFGLDPTDIFTAFGGNQGVSTQELTLFNRMLGGDLKAFSYAHREGLFGGHFSDPGWNFVNQFGEPIYARDGMAYLQFAQSHGFGPQGPIRDHLPVWMQQAMPGYGMTGAQAFQEQLGHSHMPGGYYQAWADGGMKGAQFWVQMQMADLQAASAGIQLRQLQAQRAHLWGGGTWDAPGAGSMWHLEDMLRSLQHTSTMATFDYQERATAAQRAHTLDQRDITTRRMDVTHDWQRHNLGYQRVMSHLQQAWTREDWAYQDTMAALGFEWSMEDINEAIRMATGRDRRQLITRRDRLVTQHNLEQEQVDVERSRQEQTWAIQEERFERQVEYQETLMELEREAFDLTSSHQDEMHQMQMEDFARRREEYLEEHRLREQMNERQREHQAEMMALQEQSIGIQAASAALQRQMAEDAYNETKKYEEEALGPMVEAMESDPARIFSELFAEMVDSMAGVNTNAISEARGMFNEMGNRQLGFNARNLQDLFQAIANMSPAHIRAVRQALMEMVE